MAGEIASGLFALAGAAVGGLASYVGTSAEVRDRRREARQSRLDQLQDTRRQVYVEFVKCADLLADSIRDIYSYANAAEVPLDTSKHYLATWEAVVESCATVEVVGPPTVAVAGRQFFKALSEMCNQVDPWMRGKDWSDEDDKAFSRETAAKKASRAVFLQAAQVAVAS